jgi:hypothetical protein
MASSDDILGKADALLRRSAGTPVGVDTGAVPVLTDFVDVAGSEDATLVAGEVATQVMTTVEAQLAALLEERVSKLVADDIQVAVAAALEELRPQLADIVARAVTEALERRQVK